MPGVPPWRSAAPRWCFAAPRCSTRSPRSRPSVPRCWPPAPRCWTAGSCGSPQLPRNWLISRCSGPAPRAGRDAVIPSAAGASDRGASLKRTTKYGPGGRNRQRADLEVDPPSACRHASGPPADRGVGLRTSSTAVRRSRSSPSRTILRRFGSARPGPAPGTHRFARGTGGCPGRRRPRPRRGVHREHSRSASRWTSTGVGSGARPWPRALPGPGSRTEKSKRVGRARPAAGRSCASRPPARTGR